MESSNLENIQKTIVKNTSPLLKIFMRSRKVHTKTNQTTKQQQQRQRRQATTSNNNQNNKQQQ